MASSLTTASSSAVGKASATLRPLNNRYHSLSHFSFRVSPKPKLRIFTKGLQPSRNCPTVVKAQLNEDGVGGSSNASSTPPAKLEAVTSEAKDAKPSNDHSFGALAREESISEFIAQVSSLVKLVDSRDIVELQLKQLDCEVIIRKKEALPQPPPPAPVSLMYSQTPTLNQTVHPAPAPAPAPTSAPAPRAPTPSTSPPAVKSAKSSLPHLKCPMAGTFYRCPGPGEPPFVKVGDKVQKGQVVCIIEAMKLMNEIEADQSGTIVEVLVEDGKPVSIDMPLFVIEP
ncbi:biotin carboxyl carrier protein of acetyl-CoA carboxylase, chloroplastic isoform X2 [Quercus suber]|uniref:biotin carboxyl carrier protein of acetyl-CoA carboxylase, chloroplastic isoform X2 n=1 Tax=Quercus suber TaxID=58331 RepID=UPI000CE1F6C6|nr:biotin carboxyl carrier protein of acetyl-CoA carboxylase, chloroplastic isoform X2 [Quercus suber]POE97694.1 biotin carboxyl carrier protein of acetyl-coa carboxylase 1, chloroplastic [Quercus suber]